MHSGIFIKGISSNDPATQDAALAHARPKQWTSLPPAFRASTAKGTSAGRRKGIDGIVSEMVIAVIALRHQGKVDPVEELANGISDEVGAEIERHLSAAGPHGRGRNDHLWCVVIAAICRAYDEGVAFTLATAEDLTGAILDAINQETSDERGDEVQARDIHWQRSGVKEAFGRAAYPWLRT